LFINAVNIYGNQSKAGDQAASVPHQPGASAARSFVIGPLGDIFEIYKILLSFPGNFTFNGFDAAGSTAGTYRIVSRDGTEASSL
jgi:hypothetical protein